MSHPRLAASLPEINRLDFHHAIHKALRLGHCHMLAALGAQDFNPDTQTHSLIEKLRELIHFCEVHREAERRHIHQPLEHRKPGTSARSHERLRSNHQSIAEIQSLIRALEVAIPTRRPIAGMVLYQRYALFAATDIERMHEDESELLVALQAAFTEEELSEIEDSIISAFDSAQMALIMALMIPALNGIERAGMLTKLQAAMPVTSAIDEARHAVSQPPTSCTHL